MEKACIILSAEEALSAISLDLRQYEPQTMLLGAIGADLCGSDAFLRQPGESGAWVRLAGEQNMRWLEGAELVELVCRRLLAADLRLDALAAFCGRVFQTRAQVVFDPRSGRRAIQIETGMESFSCRQCGQCCRALVYHDGVDAQDVARWKAAGRDDILRWVGVAQDRQGRKSYRIWVIPDTNLYADTCPFLEAEPRTDRWSCRIQDTKPRICRQYPATRKHAMMTGCPGF